MLISPDSGDMMVGESTDQISKDYGIDKDSEGDYIKVKNILGGTDGSGEILVDSLGNKIGKSNERIGVIANEERKRLF